MDNSIAINNELWRLKHGPSVGQRPGGLGTVRFIVRCPLGAADVMSKVKGLLCCIDEVVLRSWPNDEEWERLLPSWFVDACVPSMNQEEANKWLSWWSHLTPEEQSKAEIEKEWSLADWLYWMHPDNRQWHWWDAACIDEVDHIIFAVEVSAWPFPWGGLRWMFKAAGASSVEAE